MDCPNCGFRINTYGRRCGRCGVTIPPGQYLLEKSGVVERSAPITAAAARSARGPTHSIASLGDRLIAAMLDSVVVFGAFSIISAWSFRRWSISNGDEFHLTSASLLMAGSLSAAFLF